MTAHPKPDPLDDFSNAFVGPLSLDSQLRQTVQLCWAMLPKEKRTVENVKTEISRVLERIFRDLDEDVNVFTGNL